jgi:hypothetical protein
MDVTENIEFNVDFLRSIGRQKLIDAVFDMFWAGVTCLKHEGFWEEREWRAIYTPMPHPSLMEAETKVIAGVPQIVYKVPLDVAVSDALADLDLSRMFDRLIIGPSPYPWVMYKASAGSISPYCSPRLPALSVAAITRHSGLCRASRP